MSLNNGASDWSLTGLSDAIYSYITVATQLIVGAISAATTGFAVTIKGAVNSTKSGIIDIISSGGTRVWNMTTDSNNHMSFNYTPTSLNDVLHLSPLGISANQTSANVYDIEGPQIVGTASTNQLGIRKGNAGTALFFNVAANPASTDRSLTLSDPGANDTVAYLNLAQTMAAKTLTNCASITMSTTGGTAFNYGKSTSNATTWQHGANASASTTVKYCRWGPMYILIIPVFTFVTSGSATADITSNTAIDADFRPNRVLSGYVSVINNGSQENGFVILDAAGVLTLRRDTASNWTTASSCGANESHICVLLA